MYWNDHEPGHFHALFAEYRAVIDIEKLTLIDGHLPKPKLRAVLNWAAWAAWAAPRKSALWNAWNSTQSRLPPGPIE
jgi:hypothetical protein